MSSEGSRRLALIVACDRYSDPELKQLQAPPKDAEALQGIFENPKIGGFKVASLINQPYWIVKEKIDEFIQSCSREDTLLLYFSCHGIKDKKGLLYFATENTNSKRLFSTGIEANFVNSMLDHCKARQKVVLLDCCYSGAIEKGRVHRGGADKQINVSEYLGKGSVIITASDSMQYALEDDEIKSLRTGSYFTSALVEGLENGRADVNNDGKITYSELYDYVYKYVRGITPNQSPTLITHGVEGDFVIFKNIQGSISSESKPSPPAMQDPFLQFIEEASMYLEQGQYDKAIKKFDGILALNEGHIEALNGKGVALCNQEKYEEALQCFNEVLKIRPRHPHASTYVKIITDRISKGSNAEVKPSDKVAKQEAELEKRTEGKVIQALNESTKVPSELIKEGDQLCEKGMYQDAVLRYGEALKVEPRSKIAWFNKGAALYTLGKYEEAVKCADKVIEIDPSYADAWFYKGYSLHNLSRYEEAIKCYDKAIELKPEHVEALENKAIALENIDRRDEAAACYDRINQIRGWGWPNLGKKNDDSSQHEQRPAPLYDIGKVWMAKGDDLSTLDNENVLKEADKVLMTNPNHIAALIAKGTAVFNLAKQGTNPISKMTKYREAEGYLKKAAWILNIETQKDTKARPTLPRNQAAPSENMEKLKIVTSTLTSLYEDMIKVSRSDR